MDEQNTSTPAGPAPSPIYQESQEKNAKWLWLLIVLIIAAGVVFAFFRGIGPFANFKLGGAEETVSPTPESFVSSSPLSSPSPLEEVDKGEPNIRILNGSGVAGLATSAKDFLEGLGWKVASVGNADSYDFEQTEVIFKGDSKKFESSLTKDLSQKYSVLVSSGELDATDSADIEIIVGKK